MVGNSSQRMVSIYNYSIIFVNRDTTRHDTNNDYVKIYKFKHDLISFWVTRHDTYNLFINLVI